MANRHQRRKRALAKQAAKLENLAQAQRSATIAETVRKNKSTPIERNYYPSCVLGRAGAVMPRARVMRNTKSLDYLPRGTIAHGFNKG